MDKHNKMLIDATHAEETRVVVLRNSRVEEFDFESAARKLLRGNIYLAKVTRVEPSLQAAFVEYGGNRHGFLAFSEIHPDYYQIPVADREALKQAEAEAEAAAEAESDERARRRSRGRRQRSAPRAEGYGDQPYVDRGEGYVADRNAEPPFERASGDEYERAAPLELDRPEHDRHQLDLDGVGERLPGPDADPVHSDNGYDRDRNLRSGDGGLDETEQVEDVATDDDVLEEVPERPRRRVRQYKIQEVIKRRQIILIQIVKEERGSKGAALTTYISLAGRYTVLMPNTGRGGGISRKITQAQDRKRLKMIAEELEVPEGMGLIIRTAGAARTMQEIRRDYDYLLRLWESVRDLTLSSTAPCLVYEEGNLIKRSIRDLYSKDITEILVAGDTAYREASQFMGMLMPSHVEDVIHYRAPEPLFNRFGIERQLTAMFNPVVTLRSGGYIVINQTEALVAVDVNSGRSTREFSIEETALNTNIEASEEIARQLKLRDLAGLIVVDFIDMEENRNNRTVERRLKDALRHDRARIQVGRISHFGLLEMSRQRLRTGVVEGSTSQCPHCQGTGIIRSTESIALAVLRSLEEQLMRQPASVLVQTNAAVALYILNNKRPYINEMERRFGITISIEANERMHGANFAVERTAQAGDPAKVNRTAVNMEWGFEGAESEAETAHEDREPARSVSRDDRDRDFDRDEGDSRDDGVGRRRRRRGRGPRDPERTGQARSLEESRDGNRDSERSRDFHAEEPRADGARDSRRSRSNVEEPREYSRNGPRYDDDGHGDGRSASFDARPDHRSDGPGVADDDGEARHAPVARDDLGDGEGGDRGPRKGRRRGRRGGRGGRSRGHDDLRTSEGGLDDSGPREHQSDRDEVDGGRIGSERSRREPGRKSGREPLREPREDRPSRPSDWPEDVREETPRHSIIETAQYADAHQREPQRPHVVETVPGPSGSADADAGSGRSSRKGWWQRRFGGGE